MTYDRYYFSTLGEEEKKIYKKMYDGLNASKQTITFCLQNQNLQRLREIFQYINFDNPHLFYVDFTEFSYQQNLLSVQVIPSYLYSQDEIKEIKSKIDIVLGKIIAKVDGKTEYEKELNIHDILISNIAYDYVGLEQPRANSVKNNTILGPLFFKSAVCEGIAKVTKLLLNLLNIKCIVAVGNDLKTNQQHAWNIVKVNNENYHLDITWDISSSTDNFLCHDYFNLTTFDIQKDHKLRYKYPLCDKNNANYFAKNKLIANSINDIKRIVKTQIATDRILFKTTIDITQARRICENELRNNNYSGKMTLVINEKQGVVTIHLQKSIVSIFKKLF